MQSNKQLVQELNDIIQNNINVVQGYKKAADMVESVQLKNIFYDHADQRQKFANDLMYEVKLMGGWPANETTLGGELRQVWMDFKTAFSADNEEAIIDECIRGEEVSLDKYQYIIEYGDLPIAIKQLLSIQMNVVEDYLFELKSLQKIKN